MPTSRRENRVVETYARSLMESAKADGRVFDDLKNLEVLAQASPELLAALSCMVTRGQLDMLPQVAEAFRAMADEDKDVVGVTVTTAIPLDDELRAKIRARLEQDLDREVFLIEQVDPTIIGGLVLEARGQRRDVSVKTQLRAARKTLVETTMKAGGDLA
ncbi:F0F1 ATP synthase subunit delta [Enorma phocaeensis]|uniref:ATP synthase subunit delta n=1 Tax=Enorma phocaeensis TaxID=1871019 RepID=A0ABT7VB58_9ACTN|nr:FoF1 ATP synthase subunit delta [Enorma phocaeensis]MDM8275716.1 FoF1 ATP synthase subunit delta [Enorma phocaeensis]